MTTLLSVAITMLCGVGLYASLFMLAKTKRAERGELTEPSVVQSPRARLLGGVPNAAIGIIYYPALAIAVWTARPAILVAALGACVLAALMSVALAYSLLFVTRRSCTFCWTGHAINWSLVPLCATLFKMNILSYGKWF